MLLIGNVFIGCLSTLVGGGEDLVPPAHVGEAVPPVFRKCSPCPPLVLFSLDDLSGLVEGGGDPELVLVRFPVPILDLTADHAVARTLIHPLQRDPDPTKFE